MGGAAGHLQHVVEDLNLTFSEVKDIIVSASEGRLERVTEKLDGINLVFTYDLSSFSLKVARNGSDIKKGGMNAAELSKKFFGRGNLEDAFNNSFKILNDALSVLPEQVLFDVFGLDGNKWYSIEIIYSESPNTINYDGSNIVFHEWPVFEITEDGSISQVEDSSGVEILSSHVDKMQKSIDSTKWRIKGPSLLDIKRMSNGSVADECLARIDAAMASAGVSDSDTMYDYLRSLMSVEVEELNIDPTAEEAVVERAIQSPGSPGLPAIRKMLSKEQYPIVSKFIKNSSQLVKRMMSPIEDAINDFVVELLRGINSTLISDNQAEIERIKKRVRRAISAIESSGNELAMQVLQAEMERLKDVENITSAMEGVVFFYKGKAYKFTGPFRAFHQILSLFTFGRKGIPPMDLGESTLVEMIKRMVNEGGRMFDTQPIPLSVFKQIWPSLRSDVLSLGVDSVEQIGSTGKKNLMGDIDLAVSFDGQRDELYDRAVEKFGEEFVSKVGSNIVTVMYPFDDGFVQVDLMMGNLNYLKWSRFGTSNIESHEHFSPLKGVARNILFAVINRYLSRVAFPEEEQSKLDRVKYNVDFDRGFYRVVQTRRNKKPGKPPTKAWKTVEKELVSDDPDEIARVMFGDQVSSKDLLRFEDVVEALYESPVLSKYATEILRKFSEEMREILSKNPSYLGSDPDAAMSYINDLVR